MYNYSDNASKYAKKMERRFDSSDFVKSAAVLANLAQSFMKDAKDEVSYDAMKYAKTQGRKNLRKVESYFGIHPTRNYIYAAGAGALLAYFLVPRK